VESTTERLAVTRELLIDASPETVWEFLVDPEKIVRWMGTSATFDVRPGGSYRLDVIPGHIASGEFVEIDPPHRLVYTFGWEPGSGSSVAPGSTTVEFELAPEGEGTMLRFTHRGLASAESAASHATGWEHYLERLAIVAAGGDAGVDPSLAGPTE
jgi:uncharacterized protein YndB with AHSA1/START domain